MKKKFRHGRRGVLARFISPSALQQFPKVTIRTTSNQTPIIFQFNPYIQIFRTKFVSCANLSFRIFDI
ncbi:MAG: hypothetical protein ACLVAA_05345 [Ruthenibacterium sp.]